MLMGLSLIWTSLAIAIFLTSVVLLTYWLARLKVQKIVVLPIRHVWQIFFANFPTIFILSYLVLNEMWLSIVSGMLLLLSLVCLLEFFLRRVQTKSGLERIDIRYNSGKNGLQVSYDEAREASGDYPRRYMTELYYDSMRLLAVRVSPQNGIKNRFKNGGGTMVIPTTFVCPKFRLKTAFELQPTNQRNGIKISYFLADQQHLVTVKSQTI